MLEQNHTILIVEDEVSLRGALRAKLTKEGYKVLEGTNGQEGLEMALREKPDLILMDIIMPIMDGITALFKLRQDSWGKNAKVIILTNLSDPGKEIIAESQGVAGYLVKTNWKLEDLLKRIKSVLE